MDPRGVIDSFLAGRRFAVVGVSQNPQDFSRALVKEMRDRGYEIVPVRPGLAEVDGVTVYPRVQDVPGRLDGVIVMTSAETAKGVVRDCAEAGVSRVWLYRAAGDGAVSEEAVSFCKEKGIEVVPGECPLMFLGGSIHNMHRSLRQMTGSLPLRGRELRTANQVTRGLLAALIALELFNALGAFYGGGSMILDPFGRPMGMSPPGEMAGLRFGSYLIPGVVLLIANGLLPTAVVIGALAKQRWSVRGHVFAGLVLTGWTAVEVMMLGWVSFLQPLMLGVGIALLALGWLYHARFEAGRRHLAVAA